MLLVCVGILVSKLLLLYETRKVYNCHRDTARKLVGSCYFSHRMIILVDDLSIR
jgi:hypothetical protein